MQNYGNVREHVRKFFDTVDKLNEIEVLRKRGNRRRVGCTIGRISNLDIIGAEKKVIYKANECKKKTERANRLRTAINCIELRANEDFSDTKTANRAESIRCDNV